MDPFVTYVLDTFRHLYDVPEEVQIIYGEYLSDNSKKVSIQNNAGSFFKERTKINPKKIVYKNWQDTKIPFLFESSDLNQLIECTEKQATINYDIIAASFYFLSSWQEFVTSKEDYADGRFPYHQSLQYQLKTAQIPWVNYYFDILKTSVEKVYKIKLDTQKGDSKFHIAVTHDIDTLFSGWLQEGYHAIKKGNLLHPIRLLLNRIGDRGRERDPWYNLTELYNTVKQLGGNSTYYFLANTEDIENKKQADYELEDPILQEQIKKLREHGAEIGIHGSIGTHLNAEMLQKEVRLLDVDITGGRSHYLYYDIHKTPQVFQEAGLQYDSTLGFAEQAGFRNAFAHPFYLYDLKNNRQTDVLEIPLIIMDATLQHKKYMHLKPKDSFAETLPILQELEKFHGAASILWHNSYFSDYKYEGWGEVFWELLNYCKDQHGSAVSASEIVPYYSYQTN